MEHRVPRTGFVLSIWKGNTYPQLSKDRALENTWQPQGNHLIMSYHPAFWGGSQQFLASASGWVHLETIRPYLLHSSLLSTCSCVYSPYSSFLHSFHPNKLVENMFLLCTEPTKTEGLSSLLSFFHSWDPRAAQDLRIHLQDGAQLLPSFLTKELNYWWTKPEAFKVKICTINHMPADDPKLNI